MKIHLTKPLFAWDCLEDTPTLKTIKQLLDTLPEEKLLASLQAARGRGRDDYPVRVLWGVAVLAIAVRHPTIEHCLGELRRNESLRKLIGIESEEQVPSKWNLSRFLDTLGWGPHLSLLHEVFDQIVRRLGEAVPGLGENTAGDAERIMCCSERTTERDGLLQLFNGTRCCSLPQ